MFSTLRVVLVIFLAMLQLIAPLVHAHAHKKNSTLGLHIPGLESYGVDGNTFLSSTTNYYNSAGDVLVEVDSGIKENHGKSLVDLDNSYYLPSQAVVFRSSVSLFDINFSPPLQPFIYRLITPAHTPRAPPVQ
ncbi:MAG: hypothetical protein ACXW0Q_03340 [Methylovulum sp.]